MGKTIRVGIIGAGRIGRLHAEHLSFRIPGVEVAAVSDIFEEGAKKCAADFNIPVFTTDHRVIMDDKTIDAVVICSSTDTHAPMMIEAAKEGKHIFCEKPISHDLDKIREAIDAVKKAGVKLQIGFNRRFDSNFKRVRDAVVNGEVGDVHTLRITSRDPGLPPIEYIKVSGGIFLDMTIHDFDMARYLVGDEVEEIYAVGDAKIDPKVAEAGDIDTATIMLKFKNGVIGVIENSRQAVYGYDQRVEVFGSKGMINTENVTPNRARLNTADKVQEDLPLNFFMERYIDSYINEMNEFVDCIVNNKETSVSGVDGLVPVIMGMAAGKSLKEKRMVKISEIK